MSPPRCQARLRRNRSHVQRRSTTLPWLSSRRLSDRTPDPRLQANGTNLIINARLNGEIVQFPSRATPITVHLRNGERFYWPFRRLSRCAEEKYLQLHF